MRLLIILGIFLLPFFLIFLVILINKRRSWKKYYRYKKYNEMLDILSSIGSKNTIQNYYPNYKSKIKGFLMPLDLILRIILFPIAIIFIDLIYFYQLFISQEKSFHRKTILNNRPYRNCNFIPGCSNFAMGALLRYNLFYAIILCYRRFKSCNGANEGTDIP